MNEAKIFLDKKQEEHFNKFGVYADVNSKIAEWMQEYTDEVVKKLTLTDVGITLPNKDATIWEGYNKAKMQDYQNRNVLRHKDQDDYYSGWMDCYDWISKGN